MSPLGHEPSPWAELGIARSVRVHNTLLYLTNILSFLFPSTLHVSARSARLHTHTRLIESKSTGLPPSPRRGQV